MDKLSILLLADPREAAPITKALQERQWLVTTVQEVGEAACRLRDGQYQLLLFQADPPKDWPSFFAALPAADAPPVLVLARQPTIGEAVAAVRAGAADYLQAPVPAGQLSDIIERTIAARAAAADRARHPVFANIIGQSEKIKKVFSLVEKVCDTDTTVLVHGESGTGKELIARALHYQGARRTGPFVPVNCGAIPGELLESELFGHEKGAFTHAIRTRVGRFEMGHGGTVFLDEVSEMSPMLQVKLLRVLQEREFERIGGTKTIKSDFRVVAATNRDLEEEVRQGSFREDLYYRLNVIPIEAPPLRERPSDIPLLVSHFIEKFNASKHKTISGVSSGALACLVNFDWPGNVRELENVIERMVILATSDELTEEDLPGRLREKNGTARVAVEAVPDEGFVLSEVVADFEQRLIIQALNQTGWVKNQAAKLLNVNRTTLLEKMKRYNLIQPSAPA
ncbi:MAG: sigma-54 dependent transcriptional regulator [Desulfobacteraceae bacterium]|nr:sigma-54 dependent transcriptional regulator [Desulfobacteraceae bacterium]